MIGVCLKYEQINYGSKLQALATVKMLENMSLDYEIIRYNKKSLKFIIKYLMRCFNLVFLNDRYDQFQRIIEYKKHPQVLAQIQKRNGMFSDFDKQFESHLSQFYKSYDELKMQCKNKYSKVLTCSDQLWSPAALGSGFYNLMFAPDDMTKVSWASSFGVSNIPWYQKKRTARYLNRIEHISMRENRGAEIVKELTGKDVPVLLDPVFVFDKVQWEDLVKYQPAEFEPYIFCYFLGDNEEHRKQALELQKLTGLKIVTLRHLDRYVDFDENFGDYAPYDVDPQRFLNILRNAQYVLTDSFHGTAFSVLCEKKFLVFDRYSDSSGNSKNSRIDSVCKNLGLEDRRFSDKKDILQAVDKDIDYESVREKTSNYREQTKEYLKNALSK